MLPGFAFGILMLAVYVVTIDHDCGALRGCADLLGISETIDNFITHLTSEDSLAKLFNTKQISSLPKVENKGALHDQCTCAARVTGLLQTSDRRSKSMV